VTLNKAGVHLIRFFESLRLDRYQDSKGLWTIGWGHLITPAEEKAGRFPLGKEITKEQANQLLSEDLQGAVNGVSQALRVQISSNQFSALVSFAFNLGVSALAKSKLMGYINAGNIDRAVPEFELWDNATIDGKLQEVKGLVSRRKCEQFLFTLPDGAVESGSWKAQTVVLTEEVLQQLAGVPKNCFVTLLRPGVG
jgi:lysozyme